MRHFVHAMALPLVAMLVLGDAGPGAAQQAAPGRQDQGGRSSGIGNSRDKDLPMEITADNLEVQRDNRKAIFRGNVDVVQGGTRMRADMMVVHYRERDERDRARQQTANSNAGAIYRIDAFGKVFISADNETARGDKGTYDLDRRVLISEGNVVLTRDKDVLNCAKLTMNFDSKQNYCENAPGGRVKGIFNPGGGGS